MADELKVSFLLQCDQEYRIIKTFWHQPVYLISPYQKDLMDLFAESDRQSVKMMIQQAGQKPDAEFCIPSCLLVSPKVRISLFLMMMGSQFLICGHSEVREGVDCVHSESKEIIFKFMDVIRTSDPDLMTVNQKMIRDQFEQIQKLNNNLINTQRQLQKANSRLNQLNQDLSNRLVKDALTGLVSRYQYREEIERMIRQAPDRYGLFTFIDLDDFKTINDTYGHRAGDDYLKEFASRLTQIPLTPLICMRIAGDEFGLYSHGYGQVSEQEAAAIWTCLETIVLRKPVAIQDTTVYFSCSAGIAVYGQDTHDIYDLIEYADHAMYEAKKSGKNSFRKYASLQPGPKSL